MSILVLEIDYQLSMFAFISEKSKTKITTCITNYWCSGVFPAKFLILKTGAKIISYCNTKHSFPPFFFFVATLIDDVRSSNGDSDKMEVRSLLHAPFSTMWVTSSSRLGRIMSYILYLLPNRGIWRIKHDGTCKKKKQLCHTHVQEGWFLWGLQWRNLEMKCEREKSDVVPLLLLNKLDPSQI